MLTSDQMPVVAPGDVVLDVVISVGLPAESMNCARTRSSLPRVPGCLAVVVTTPTEFCAVTGRSGRLLIALATAVAMTVGVSPDATGTSIGVPHTVRWSVNAAVAVVARVRVAMAAAPPLSTEAQP